MNEFLKSAQQTVLERLASPLIGGFCLSWCVWNYKFLVILFSAAGVTQTFTLIEEHAFTNWLDILTLGFFGPLGTALLYIFVYPYPARWIYKFTLEQQRRSNEILEKTLDEKPISEEKARILRAKIREMEKNKGDELEALHQTIDDLQRLLADKSKESISKNEKIIADGIKVEGAEW